MKYIIRFKKTGVICYTSHLDIMKVFKRSFKRAGVYLAYSQGFNPHPKMGFAQPLSLGYEGMEEYIEFETEDSKEEKTGEEIFEFLREIMPEGLELLSIEEAHNLKKTLAALTVSAEYTIRIPISRPIDKNQRELWNEYMGRDEIPAMKRQKKKKELVKINIKDKIRKITFDPHQDLLTIDCLLDSGSDSNLSPELVITTVLECFNIDTNRNDISVTRNKIHFCS